MHKEEKRVEKVKLWIEIGLAILIFAVVLKNNYKDTLQSKEYSKKEVQTDEVQMAEKENKNARTKIDKVEKEEAVQPTSTDGFYPIMGKSDVTVDKMVTYFKENGGEYPKDAMKQGGADSIETFCQMYYDEAVAEGVRPEVAFAQTMIETGWLQYGGDSTVEQFNFAGIGTTGGGVKGESYPDVQTGIRAQIQHLKAYATEEELKQNCVDTRYDYVKKGCAPYVEWLGQKENPEGTGWATAERYGYSIVRVIRDLSEK